jgi:hypothetical protein
MHVLGSPPTAPSESQNGNFGFVHWPSGHIRAGFFFVAHPIATNPMNAQLNATLDISRPQ